MRYAIYFTPPSNDALLKVAANWPQRLQRRSGENACDSLSCDR